MTHSSSSAAPRLGVLLLAGGVILGLALGARHVQGLFLLPVSQAHGWPRETYGLAMALQNLVWGLAQPVAGWIADRRGSARVLAGGLLLYALGLAGMAFAHGALPFMLAAGLCIGLAQAGTTFGVIYAAMTRLAPPSQRGMALGVTGALGGLGQFLLVPGAQVAIDLLDWRGALWLMAALLLAALVLAPILRDRPSASAANEGSAPIALAVRQPGFWLLTAGFLTCGFQLAFIATHLPAYLAELGLGHQGVAALAIVALFNIAGTYACGVLGARWPRQRLLSVLYLLRAAAIAAFIAAPATPLTVYVFAAVMGLLWLGTVPLTNGLIAQVYGTRNLGTLFGLVFVGHQLGSFLGVWLGARLYDRLHDYTPVWLLAIALGLLAAALHWPISTRPLAAPRAAVA